MKPYRVQVIIPVYNSKKTIARCLESLKSQTFSQWQALIADDASTDGSAEIIKTELPVSFKNSGPALISAIEKHHPDAVICVGQAGGYAGIAIERTAVNLQDAAAVDNDGIQPEEQPVVADGPDGYFSSLPVKRIADALKSNEIPAFVSNSAGTYVCNNVMYTLLHLIHSKHLPIRGGFIHVPFSVEQAACKAPGTPSMALEYMTKGLELAVRTVESERI